MFTAPPDDILAVLDELLGSRAHTQQIIALASATVLTASPMAEQDSWLLTVQKNIPQRPDSLSGITLTNRRGTVTHPVPDSSQRAALKHLLDTLHRQHGGSTRDILQRLSYLAADALASSDSGGVERWSQLLRRTHQTVRHGYLSSNPELN